MKLHTCFVDENVLWVVMEWVDGGDLKGAWLDLSIDRWPTEKICYARVFCPCLRLCLARATRRPRAGTEGMDTTQPITNPNLNPHRKRDHSNRCVPT